MKTDIAWFDFASGELSPRMKGRIDVSKYFNGAESLLNMVVQPQGGITRRPGTALIAQAASNSVAAKLIPFVFSTVQSYVIELGDLLARFYANDGQVTSAGSPVQIAMPYGAADLATLNYTQSADTLYLTHPNYALRTLQRTGATSFAISLLVLRDGPYLNENTSSTSLHLSGYVGTLTVTASATTGINGGLGFQATDVGRHLRIRYAGTWAWLIINSVSSATVCTATVQPAVDNGAFQVDGTQWAPNTTYPVGAIVSNASMICYICTTSGYSAGSGGPTGVPTTPIQDGTCVWQWTAGLPVNTPQWMLGKFYVGNYPSLCMFWQNRLILAGAESAPNSIVASVIGDFPNFAPTQCDGTVTAINALNWTIDDDQVNAITWLSPAGSAQTMQLGIGTSGSEDIMQPATQASALSATNVQAYRETAMGSAPNVRPLRVGKSVLFVNRPGLKLHEWTFQWQVNGYTAPDLAVLADHLPAPGIAEMAYQQNPHGVVWMRRQDGQLVGMTYLRDQDVVAWHHHQLGGTYYGGPPVIDSLCVIPSTSGSPDELWLAVLRTVGGVPFRSIEVLQPYFTNMPAEAAWFVDCGISSALTPQATSLIITGPTDSALKGEPAALTGTATLQAGSSVFATTGQILRANGGIIRIDSANGTTATGAVLAPLWSLAPVAANGWTLDTPRTVFSGLSPLAGETLAVNTDGATQGPLTVSGGGSITLPVAATRVLAGYGYVSKAVTMPAEPGRGSGAPAAGKSKRLDTLYLRLLETIGGSIGQRQQDPLSQQMTEIVEPIQARWMGDAMDMPPRLFSGVLRLKPRGGDDPEARVVVMQDQPLPMTVLGISGRMNLEEITPQ